MTNYLVNLSEARDRLEFQKDQFKSLGLCFKRFEACRDDESCVDRFRWWCVTLRPRVRGEVGCARSHATIYRKLVESGEACAAVFEDDIVLSKSMAQALVAAERKCREDPKAVVLFGDHRRFNRGEPVADEGTEIGIEPTDWDHSTEGYAIGREAAAALARAQRQVRAPADAWTYFRRKGLVHLYRATPPVCAQHPNRFGSSIGERYVVAGKPFVERCWWKFRRVIGVVLDGLLDGGRF